METTATSAADIHFKFNGKGERPTTVPSVRVQRADTLCLRPRSSSNQR